MPFEFSKIEKAPNSKEREVINQIENLPILDLDRMFILLTYFREKLASEFRIGYLKDLVSEKERASSERVKIEEVLKRANFAFQIKEYEEPDSEGKIVRFFHFFVANNENILEELERALSEKDHGTLGRLFGFPESAIKAYVERERGEKEKFDLKKAWQQLSKEEREVLKSERVLDFVTWIPSENWRQELETTRRWQKIISEKAPRLYEEIRKSGYGKFLTGEEK